MSCRILRHLITNYLSRSNVEQDKIYGYAELEKQIKCHYNKYNFCAFSKFLNTRSCYFMLQLDQKFHARLDFLILYNNVKISFSYLIFAQRQN